MAWFWPMTVVAASGLVAGLFWLRLRLQEKRARELQARVDEAVARGDIALLEIDIDGARQVKARRPEAFTVFIAPPSFEALARRLQSRGTETPEVVATRLATAREELLAIDEFDAVVVNDSVERAARELAEIIGLPPR